MKITIDQGVLPPQIVKNQIEEREDATKGERERQTDGWMDRRVGGYGDTRTHGHTHTHTILWCKMFI